MVRAEATTDIALERAARFGCVADVDAPRALHVGRLSLDIGGNARHLAFDGVEVVRCIDYPVRDGNWATVPARTLEDSLEATATDFVYRRSFEAWDGALTGNFALSGRSGDADAAVTAELTLEAQQDVVVNRAGFVLLHPIVHVAGEPLEVRRPDGTVTESRFPKRISPGQPVFEIAGLGHEVRGVSVEIAFTGEVFEMEDQRNWTDASFKTYCRPLARPRPFTIAVGDRVEQRIVIRCARQTTASSKGDTAPPVVARAPEITLALDEGVAPLDDAAVRKVRMLGVAAAQVRLTPVDALAALYSARRLEMPLDLEIVVPDGMTAADALETVAAACRRAAVAPRRVLALPEPYLASIQPEGPWPAGPTPQDCAEAARATFLTAEIGGGVLTNFTEFNRCAPHFESDYVSFGTTAIVHAADDVSVLQTLAAMPDVFESARALAGERPLRLGLAAIGMRSNPYGAAVAPNPEQTRVEMALDDPRHRGLFGAAFAVALVASAAEAGVASLSPAMVAGPLGVVAGANEAPTAGYEGRHDAVFPLFHVVRALAALTDREIVIQGRAPGDIVALRGPGRAGLRGMVANLGDEPKRFDTAGDSSVTLTPASFVAATDDSDWLWHADRRRDRTILLAPFDLAFLFAEEDGA